MDVEAVELDFTGDVWYWRGPSPFHFVTVPPDQADLLHGLSSIVTYGWGMIPVRVRIGDTRFDTSLWPKDGGYIVPLKDVVRKAEDITVGDIVTVQLALRR
jgi:hypothetical protein